MINGVTMKINVDNYIINTLKEDITSEDVSTNAVMPENKQGKADLDCGVMVGYNGKEVAVATPWFRKMNDDGKRLYYLQTANIMHKYDYLLEGLK